MEMFVTVEALDAHDVFLVGLLRQHRDIYVGRISSDNLPTFGFARFVSTKLSQSSGRCDDAIARRIKSVAAMAASICS